MKKLAAFILAVFVFGAVHAKVRVKTEVNFIPDTDTLVRYDSLYFSYSGNRHSNYDFHEFMYVFRGDLVWGMYPEFLFIDPSGVYDSTNNTIVDYDSVWYYFYESRTTLALRAILTRDYNADGTTSRLTRFVFYDSAGMVPEQREDMEYQSGRITKVWHVVYDSGSWDTVKLRSLAYDAAGRVLADSMSNIISGALQPYTITRFYYNTPAGAYWRKIEFSFNASTKAEDILARITNSFYPSGQLKSYTWERNWQSGLGFRDSVRSVFAYTAGIKGWSGQFSYDYVAPALRRNAFKVNGVNTSFLVDSMTSYRFLGADSIPSLGFRYTYNADGSPSLWEQLYYYDTTSSFVEAFTRWTYEQYDVGVDDSHPKPASCVAVFPNPVKDLLLIRYVSLIPRERLTVTITNMAGQLVHSESFVPQGSTSSIELGNRITPGLYVIDVRGRDAVLYNGTFIKK
jgi:hypothetical protein